MSALATVVGGLGELTESELRQLYLVVGVRLGIPDVPRGQRPLSVSARGSGKNRPSAKKSSQKGTFSQGNPQRKSQWANHPLYQEYSRLKKVVESQAKETKVSFNSVDTPERRAYQQAFIQWMGAKSSFRDRRKDGQEGGDEESSEDEEGDTAQKQSPTSASAGGKPPAPPTAPAGSATAKGRSPNFPSKGKGEVGSKSALK